MTDLLLALADDLEAGETLSAGREPAERLAGAFPLDRLMAAFAALRASVASHWSGRVKARPCGRFEQIVHFNGLLDQVLTAAVAVHEDRHRRAGLEQAELHAKLASSEQRLRALVTASAHAVYRLSPDGTEMRELHGRGMVADTRSPRQSFLDSYVYPDDQAVVIEAFRKAAKERRAFEIEHRYRRVDGSIGWTLTRAVPLQNEQGRITEWFGAASDVTARRQAEEALREADRTKDEFLAVLGHELRNPLAPLRTSIDLMKQARGQPELLDSLSPMMDRQLKHLVRLVDDLLDISRIGRGQIDLERRPLDLNTPIVAAVEQTEPAVMARRHDLRVQLCDARLPVEGDCVRLTQVVSNLLSNAAKYMESGGTIELSSGVENGEAVVRVRDTGYGIPPERHGQLFKLFSQIADHRAQAGGGGLGIGLALSHKLVALHGGTIEAYSEGAGRGSEFVVRLALCTSEAA